VCVESYSAMYNSDAYQYPAAPGVMESYVKYQTYGNQPGYNVRVGHHGYNDGNTATSNSMYNPQTSVTREYHYCTLFVY